MTIGREEAASALRAVASARQQAVELRGYADAGSTLIAWGLAWVAGNLVNQFSSTVAPTIWMVGIVAAALWSMTRPRRERDWRILVTIAAVVGYMLLLLVVVRADTRTGNVAASLLVAASYIVLGAWTGRRFLVLGLVLCAVVIIGWFVVPAWLFLCLALGGGGTLLVGGLWLRRA